MGIEYADLVCQAEESLAIWPSTVPANSLPSLVEAVSGWALEYPRLIDLDDFNVHANDAASTLAADLVSSMAARVLSQFVTAPTHRAGHTLDLVFTVGVTVDRITVLAVLWLDHFALRAHLNVSPRPRLGNVHILAHPQSQMDPVQLQMALRDLMPLDSSLDELVEDWYS